MRLGEDGAPHLVISVSAHDRPDVWCVAVAGELDVATCPELEAALHPILARADSLLLDLGGVSFLDAAGVGTLLTIQVAARAQGKSFRLISAHQNVRRVLDLLGLSTGLGLDAAGEYGPPRSS